MTAVSKGAILSDCGTYRYTLRRQWGDGPSLVWIMLNPSTADDEVDDPTIRRIVTFTRRDPAYGMAVVVNLYALRATDPKALAKHRDPVGPKNDDFLLGYADSLCDIVAAWGAHAPLRAAQVLTGPLRDRRLICLGTTKAGQPRHPLYVKGDQPFEVYR